MYKTKSIFIVGLLLVPTLSVASVLDNEIQNVRAACSGISESMHDLKVKAGINTAVTGVGTVASGVALGAGIAKSRADEFLTEETKRMLEKYANNPQDKIVINDMAAFERRLDEKVRESEAKAISIEEISVIEQARSKSEKLGNLRTGTMAASAVANIAGTAIAATNTVKEDLQMQIDKCIISVKKLQKEYMTAQIDNSATDQELNRASNIINACRDYEMVDLAPINNRAKGAAVFSGIAAGTGVVGTITSSIATAKQQKNINEIQNQKLDSTSNVMAGASAVTGVTATVFNATQISAIKRVVSVADKCEEVLK